MDFSKGANTNILLPNTVIQATSSGRNFGAAQQVPSPILTSMNEQSMANYSPFSPGTPITPSQSVGSQPRQYEYMIGLNISQRPRSTEAVGFATMRNMVEAYDIAQMCINVRQDELNNLDWDIVPIDDSVDPKMYESDIRKVKTFFAKPDGHMGFNDFQNTIAYDWLSIDALTIYPEFTRGGKLGALNPVDGATISPMVNYYGRVPMSPSPAYVQYVYGIPWAWLDRYHLIYAPQNRRVNKLYGFPAVEWMLTRINTDIRHILHFLYYFTEGSIPDVFINAPEDMKDGKQIKAYQDIFDSVMAGDQTQKHKMKMIPAKANVKQMKDTKFDIEFPKFMLHLACAAWKVTPAEIGFTESVNKSSGETQENVQYRRSIKPSARFFEGIYNNIIQSPRLLNMPHLKFVFHYEDETEDRLREAQIDELDIRNGVISPDEARSKRHGMRTDGTPTPRVMVVGSNVMPISQIGNVPTTAEVKKDDVPDLKEDGLEEKPKDDIAKAEHDFFHKAAQMKFENANEESFVKPFSAAIYEALQRQGEIISNDISNRLKALHKTAEVDNQASIIISVYHSESWVEDLSQVISPTIQRIYAESMRDTTAKYGYTKDEALFHKYANEYQSTRTAELVTKLDDSTRNFLREDLKTAMNEGQTPAEIKTRLKESYTFSEKRSLLIARTETGFAWNDAGISTYEKAGSRAVTVHDGDYDVDCHTADGQVWSFRYARANLLEHPNCVRSFGPALDTADIDRGDADFEREKTEGKKDKKRKKKA